MVSNSHSHLSLITYSLIFFTNHGDISADSITVTKNSLLSELADMTVQDMTVQVNVHHKHIRVARKTLIFEYFSAKLCKTLFEIKRTVLDGVSLYKKSHHNMLFFKIVCTLVY